MVGKDKPTFHASNHHMTAALMFLLIGLIIITTSISFVFSSVLNYNPSAMAQLQQPQQQQLQQQQQQQEQAYATTSTSTGGDLK
jgi:hypothetical protein